LLVSAFNGKEVTVSVLGGGALLSLVVAFIQGRQKISGIKLDSDEDQS